MAEIADIEYAEKCPLCRVPMSRLTYSQENQSLHVEYFCGRRMTYTATISPSLGDDTRECLRNQIEALKEANECGGDTTTSL